MNHRGNILSVAAAAGMMALILDGKTALTGAAAGVDLCVRTIAPSLFPFFMLSALLTRALLGQRLPFLRPVGRLCRIPEGAEPLLAAGLLGGYPVGAQSIALAVREERLHRSDAERMLGFCNNAGPSFLFGIIALQFSAAHAAWLLWLIHVLSALAVGVILPGGSGKLCASPDAQPLGIPDALEKSIRVTAAVCGWIILFHLLLAFLEKWFLWLLPAAAQVALAGLLELSNGCVQLLVVEPEGLRFVLASVLLAFGGLCVSMQTVSVAKGISLRWYFPGKLLQILISFLLATACQIFFPSDIRWNIPVPALTGAIIACVIFCTILRHRQNSSSFPLLSGV